MFACMHVCTFIQIPHYLAIIIIIIIIIFRILNNLSNGEIAQLLAEEFPSLFRPRRSSLDTMSGLSLGYAKKRRFVIACTHCSFNLFVRCLCISLDPMSGISFGAPSKRLYGGNFDEIDRTGFSGFAKRRSNFDEMDRSGFSGFAKRRSDFDEIDHSGFSGFAKRRSDFDEIDRSGFSGFAKRRSDFDEIDRSGFSGFAKRFNFDELDRNGFTGFMAKREIDSKIKLENGVKAIPSQSKVVNNESKDKTKP